MKWLMRLLNLSLVLQALGKLVTVKSIFANLEQVIRIRTGETGPDAV